MHPSFAEINPCIKNSVTIRESPRFRSLLAFSAIYGIGPHTARKLYSQGFRTIEDLEQHYGRADRGKGTELVDEDNNEGQTEENITERSIKVSLTLKEDFAEK